MDRALSRIARPVENLHVEQVMDRDEVMQWRKAERQKLIGERLAMNSDVRRRHAEQIATSLEEASAKSRG